MKHLIPGPWRLQLRLTQRQWRDWRGGLLRHFAAHDPAASERADAPQLSISQGLGSATGALLDNKLHNLGIAAARLETVVVHPGEVFSFWQAVGRPSARAGYREGRTITGAAVGTSVGGGLCQLSGMAYLLALQAGLKILERHPHSRDLYTDSTRFAPLGADATVVYGYKDLRFQNTGMAPIRLRCTLGATVVQMDLCASAPLAICEVEFVAQPLPSATRVQTLRRAGGAQAPELLSCDDYPRLA